MAEQIIRILPLALGAAINPTGILVLVAVLASSRRSAAALAMGFSAVFVAFGVLVPALGLRFSSGPPGTTSAVIDVCAGALLAVLGVRTWRKKPKPQGERARRRLGVAGGFAAGLLLAVTDFSSLLPYAMALKELALSQSPAADMAVAVAVFLAICLTPMVAPVALAFAAPRAADCVLDPVRRVLQRHGNAIVGVVCLVLAAYLAVKGIRAL